jgi:signal transduction histidine kinase
MSVVLGEDLGRFRAAFRDTFRARRPLRAEVRVRDRAGEARWLRCEGVPRLDDAGGFLGYTGCAVDITETRLAAEELERRVAERTAELMSAEETLRQAQKMEAVGQLTGGIAHDFNNMLQGVAGGLGMARRRVAEGRTGEALRYLDAVQDAAGRAAGLTRRLLSFARRQPLEPRPVDADGLVAGLADLIRRTVGPGIAVELRLRDGAGSVLCDPNELESALLNLCINARDAMPGGGRLAIGTQDLRLSAADIRDDAAAPGPYVALSVADTGTGMPPEVLGRAFEPFFTTKPLGQGTGLGLSQVWGFARQSGGLVRVESAPGRGTTVRLLLPLHEERADASGRPEAAPPAPEGGNEAGTVLLVDDEDAARQPAADRLRELGYTVLEARDGPEALRILAATRPDLLVTDVGLPNGMNGRQLAEAAREGVPGLPVLFISGYAGTSLPPGIDMIDKPFELDVLVRRVRMALEVDRRTGAGRHPGA